MKVQSEFESDNEVTIDVNPGETGLICLTLKTHADSRVGFAILAEITPDVARELAKSLCFCPPGVD